MMFLKHFRVSLSQYMGLIKYPGEIKAKWVKGGQLYSDHWWISCYDELVGVHIKSSEIFGSLASSFSWVAEVVGC